MSRRQQLASVNAPPIRLTNEGLQCDLYIYIAFSFFSPYIRVCHGKVAIHTCGLIVCRRLCPATNHLAEIEFWDCYFSAISPKYESMSWECDVNKVGYAQHCSPVWEAGQELNCLRVSLFLPLRPLKKALTPVS